MIHTDEISVDIGDKKLILQTGYMARQANGSVFAIYESGTSVLATVCCSNSPNEELDFIPLQVEYNEKYYAAGKIPGGFIKRETRPKDKEILVSRLIDRPMRPLFHKNFMREIQLIPTTLSTDKINPPDVVAMCAASAAVMISDVPFDGPIGAVRVAMIDGQYIVNPVFEEIAHAELELIIAGTLEGITMVEGGAHEVSEEQLLDAIEFARPVIAKICEAQNELVALCGKKKQPLVEVSEFALNDDIKAFARTDMEDACYVKGKENRSQAIKDVIEKTKEHFSSNVEKENVKYIYKALDELEQEIVRTNILTKKMRTDGRGPEDIRAIECKTSVLAHTHGSSLFTRGETQSLGVVTLGSASDEQIFDDIDGDRREKFLLHYNFPPYSVGETGRLMTGRREIGHGHLAYRAIQAVLPSQDVFPYTIRFVSEVLESNGSSSMATVCSGSLGLMDSGVPITSPVAGIAMGLITDERGTVVLSDILGEEDHLGDMDFKVAGTKNGITGFQMDIKVKNVSADTMRTALEQARVGRLHILNVMNDTLLEPKKELSPYAPRIITFVVDIENIGTLIGAGGKTIRSITEKHNVQANIEDNGHITIYSQDLNAGNLAKEDLLKLLEEPEVGKTYVGIVKRITDFGAFIEVLPGKDGLCHISRLSTQRVESVEDVLQLNDEVEVKIIEIDRMGRINLAMNGDDVSYASSHKSGRDDRSGGRRNDRNDRQGMRDDRRGGDRGGRRRNYEGSSFSREDRHSRRRER